MKRIFFLLACCSLALPSFGWGRLGHATVAEIAQRHLTPSARAAIDYYTGGVPLAELSSWMDEVHDEEPYATDLRGYHASICTPDCKSPLYVRKLHRDCRDGVSAMEYYRDLLVDYRSMPDSMVLVAIKAMVHIVGDFHCPAHVRYTDEENELKYMVTFLGKEQKFHSVWDSGIIQCASALKWKDYSEYADRLDTWSRRQVRAVTAGWAREWFEDGARDVRPIIRTVPEGAVLGEEFARENIELGELELRKAGYQLAKALNTIFTR